MNLKKSLLTAGLWLSLALSFPAFTFAAGSNSVYLSLPADVVVDTSYGAHTLLQTTIYVSTGGYAYLQSDGRYGPASYQPLANAYITVDGVTVSNDSLLDYRLSTNPQQHSFNVIGAAYLAPGWHTVALHAHGTKVFYVGAGTNLSILTDAATNVINNALGQDTGAYSFTTYGLQDGNPLPHATVLQNWVSSAGEPLVALASGRAYSWGSYGDPMWMIFLNGSGERNDSATYSDNDLWTGAETQAPFFSQAMYSDAGAGSHNLSLEVSELPYSAQGIENSVQYRVGAGTRLITLNGGMTVWGKATPSSALYTRGDYICAGSDQGWPGCPPAGTDALLADGWLNIPDGHNGVVMFMSKSRVQGDSSDQGGTVRLFLTIDGQRVGNDGVQQLSAPNVESTRTISASYLATGNQALAPGWHHVQAWGNVQGSFIHLALSKELPLLWFD